MRPEAPGVWTMPSLGTADSGMGGVVTPCRAWEETKSIPRGYAYPGLYGDQCTIYDLLPWVTPFYTWEAKDHLHV